MLRAPLWVFVLLLLVVLGVGVYAYFTTPLPFGLAGVVRTPGGATVASATPVTASTGARTAAGQALILGATTVQVVAIQRNQDLAASSRGPAGSFTVLQVQIQNGGNEPLTPQVGAFRLVDDGGRMYAVDPDATRAVDVAGKRRYVFDATVPPGTTLDTLLAFETPANTNALSLRVTLGYGEVELPR